MKEIARWIAVGGVFVVPFIALIVADNYFFPFITGKNFTFRIVVEIVFAAWVLLALYDPAYRPRFSWILAAFTTFIVVIFAADLLGQMPQKSFWSNFERMEGFVTIAHLFLFFIVAGSVLSTEKLWGYYFITMLVAASFMSLTVFKQIAGTAQINNLGGVRVDGTLGNATYLAIYMLFHFFIAFLLLVRSRIRWQQIVYAALMLVFAYILFKTATRGAILGLAGGLFLTTLYIALFAKGQKVVRQIALGGIALIVVLVVTFMAVKDTDFVRSDPILARIATISLESGETRFTIWGMAFEGFKERPLLGWGQGNFNYVFNKYYEPSLHSQEQWFDRVHNIIMDWLIAGGILGLAAYLGILLAAVWGAAIRPLFKREETGSFTVPERGILLGLLGGYFVHNIFVFDNIASYILFATILAFIHARVSTEIPRFAEKQIDSNVTTQIGIPVVVVTLVFSCYFVNVPHILAARDLIVAFRYTGQAGQDTGLTPENRDALYMRGYDTLRTALERNSFADQEIREQIVRVTQGVLQNQNASGEVRQSFASLAVDEIEKQVLEKPEDARVRVFAASYYRVTGNVEKALEHLAVARELSPQKQQIMFEHGLAYTQAGQYDEALAVFEEAYLLFPEFRTARIYYAAAAVRADRYDIVDELITDEYKTAFAQNDLALRALYEAKDYDRLDEIMALRIEADPTNVQERVSRAVLRNESGDTEGAIEVLQRAVEDIPSFAERGEQFIEQIRNGEI